MRSKTTMSGRSDLKAPVVLFVYCPDCGVTRRHNADRSDGSVAMYACIECDRRIELDLDP